MEAPFPAVIMKPGCDPRLTRMASSRHRLLARDIGAGYETAESRHIFRKKAAAVRL